MITLSKISKFFSNLEPWRIKNERKVTTQKKVVPSENKKVLLENQCSFWESVFVRTVIFYFAFSYVC